MELPGSDLLIFGVLVLAVGVVLIVVLAGAVISFIDRADLRRERRRLADENHKLTIEVFERRERELELKGRLMSALEQIASLSASQSGPPE